MVTAVRSLRRRWTGRLRPGWVWVPGCWTGCEALLPGWQGPVLCSVHVHSHEVGGVLAVMLLAMVLRARRAMKTGAISSSLPAPPPACPPLCLSFLVSS